MKYTLKESMAVDRSGELPTARSSANDGDDAAASFTIVVVEGPDAGASIAVDAASPARVLVGRSPVCSLRLTDAEVSRRHISLRPLKNALEVTDFGSTNGASVNGVRIREAVLAGGEAIRIGCTVLSVTRDDRRAAPLSADTSFGRMVGQSRAMRKVYPTLRELAASDRPALVEGETGTGKELAAEQIHASSSRSGRQFAVLSCNALPAEQLEQRLFGADGLLASAAGGTVYIDEVAALPLELQWRIVAELQSKQMPVRLVFGTRRDLDREVGEKAFREDLLDLLASGRVELPPLREREGDVAVLARAFWTALAEAEPERGVPALPADFLPRFERYDWPGNVRELSRAVSARFYLGELAPWRGRKDVRADDFITQVVDNELPLSEARRVVVEEFERKYVTYMLARHGSTRDAARASDVALRYFQLLLARIEK